MIVNRLKLVMETLITLTQCNFVLGRQIIDNIIIGQEMFHTMRHKNRETRYMVIKVDLKKAFGRLRWPFIRETLLEANLPQLMVDTIMNCWSLACIVYCYVERSKNITIYTFSWSKTGRPAFPYLFVLCIERLNHLIEDMVYKGAWKLVLASGGGPPLSNLFFADDLILFGEASIEQAKVMKYCLDLFYSASG